MIDCGPLLFRFYVPERGCWPPQEPRPHAGWVACRPAPLHTIDWRRRQTPPELSSCMMSGIRRLGREIRGDLPQKMK